MTITIKSNPDGVTGAIQVNGVDKVTIGSSGITAGSFAPNSIAPADIAQKLTLGTSVATTSGTSIDFTGIPSWVKRITVMFNGVSTNGTQLVRIQLGTTAGPTTTGYSGMRSAFNGSSATTSAALSNGFDISDSGASDVRYGTAVFTNITGNTWVCSASFSDTTSTFTNIINGSIVLTATLDRIRITNAGADTFDAGSVNILYE